MKAMAGNRIGPRQEVKGEKVIALFRLITVKPIKSFKTVVLCLEGKRGQGTQTGANISSVMKHFLSNKT